MRLLWKCDHCTHFEVSEVVMKEHEEACSFSPDRKNCWTCEHRNVGGFDEGDDCDKHSWSFMEDVQTGTVTCPDWEFKHD